MFTLTYLVPIIMLIGLKWIYLKPGSSVKDWFFNNLNPGCSGCDYNKCSLPDLLIFIPIFNCVYIVYLMMYNPIKKFYKNKLKKYWELFINLNVK